MYPAFITLIFLFWYYSTIRERKNYYYKIFFTKFVSLTRHKGIEGDGGVGAVGARKRKSGGWDC